MKQINLVFVTGKGTNMDIVVDDSNLDKVTALLDDKTESLLTPLGFVNTADVASYTVNDYTDPVQPPSPALAGGDGNEDINLK